MAPKKAQRVCVVREEGKEEQTVRGRIERWLWLRDSYLLEVFQIVAGWVFEPGLLTPR